MFCVNCGKSVEEGTLFCTGCGTKIEYPVEEASVENGETQEVTEEDVVDQAVESAEPKISKSTATKSKKAPIAVIILLVLLIVCGVAGIAFLVYINKTRWENWVTDYEQSMTGYYLSEEQKEKYEDYVKDAREATGDEERDALQSNMERLQKDVKEENEEYIKQMDENAQKIENDYDLTYALEEELTEIEASKTKYTELRQALNYPEALEETKHCMELQAKASEIREGWDIEIQQKDVSEYPRVKVYFTVEDESGNAVEQLDKNLFFLSVKDKESGKYIRQDVVNAAQLNENESLNVNLVADVSGSMYENMSATKDVMNSFLDTVQFDVGDQVGLIAFDDISYELCDFTSNKSELTSAVNGMTDGGLTKLYDTLIEAVQIVLPQSGAKCVIAFTDGYDNRSASSVQDVIDYANLYQVPIFIIGIGSDVETDVLRNIAESTGGFYKSVDYVDSSFEDIYSEIYRVQKEIYCLEYLATDDNMNKEQDISIYVHNRENGGQAECQYTASYDYFGILLQQYLTSYLDALEEGKFSVMKDAGYMSPDGGIAKEMKPYIKKNKDTLEEQLLSCMITDIEYVDKDTYVVKTEEVYDIWQERDYASEVKGSKQDDEKAAIRYLKDNDYDLEYIEEEGMKISIHKTRTLQGHFVIRRNSEGKWQFADYKSNYEVLEAEVYTAYPIYD